MKRRDTETADETLQLIFPWTSPTLPCVSPSCWDLFLPVCSRRSYCPLPHAANLSPLTLDFTLFKPSQIWSPQALIRCSLLLSAGQTPVCQDSPSALWQQNTQITLMPLLRKPPLVCLKAPHPESWKDVRVDRNLNLTLPPPWRCVCPSDSWRGQSA